MPESSSVVAATATLAGLVAHDTRADLAKTLAPVTGQARARMVEAFAQARGEPVLASSGCVGATDVAGLAPLAAAAPVDQALAQIRADPAWRPDDLSAARVCLLVGRIPVRDRVWLQISGQDLDGHRALWADLVRRAERRWQAAPACLLGFTAWQQGDGTFARIALERAQQADPRYTMAGLLLHVLDAGLAPSAWDDVGARLTAPSRRQRRAAGKTRAS